MNETLEKDFNVSVCQTSFLHEIHFFFLRLHEIHLNAKEKPFSFSKARLNHIIFFTPISLYRKDRDLSPFFHKSGGIYIYGDDMDKKFDVTYIRTIFCFYLLF